MKQDELYGALRQKAEQVVGRAMSTPRDFDAKEAHDGEASDNKVVKRWSETAKDALFLT